MPRSFNTAGPCPSDIHYMLSPLRMDLCLRYGQVTLGIEIKVWRDKKADPLTKGLDNQERLHGRCGRIDKTLP